MSRRRAAKKRSILPDPKFGDELIGKFINHVMREGKKSIAARIVYTALDIIAEKMSKTHDKDKKPVSESVALAFFKEALENIYPVVEVRSRRVGGATYQVPVEIRPSRRVTLAICWLIEGAGQRKEKTMGQRLANEILDAKDNRGVAIRKRDDMRRMAQANQAFAHFHWKDSN